MLPVGAVRRRRFPRETGVDGDVRGFFALPIEGVGRSGWESDPKGPVESTRFSNGAKEFERGMLCKTETFRDAHLPFPGATVAQVEASSLAGFGVEASREVEGPWRKFSWSESIEWRLNASSIRRSIDNNSCLSSEISGITADTVPGKQSSEAVAMAR